MATKGVFPEEGFCEAGGQARIGGLSKFPDVLSMGHMDKSKMMVWLDGKLVPRNEACISVYDHGLLYGDGVFEGIRQYNGRIFEKSSHLKRLFESAQAIRLKIPFTLEQLGQAIEETTAANQFRDCYIRLVVTRGGVPGDFAQEL